MSIKREALYLNNVNFPYKEIVKIEGIFKNQASAGFSGNGNGTRRSIQMLSGTNGGYTVTFPQLSQKEIDKLEEYGEITVINYGSITFSFGSEQFLVKMEMQPTLIPSNTDGYQMTFIRVDE